MTINAAAAAKEAYDGYVDPALHTIEEGIRRARRAVADGRRTVDECANEAEHQIRRHPFSVVAAGLGVGMLAGIVIGAAWVSAARGR